MPNKNQEHEPTIERLARCSRFASWLRASGGDNARLELLKSVAGDRSVFKLPASARDREAVIIKFRPGAGLPDPSRPQPPPEALRFYPETLLHCAECGVRVDRLAEGASLDRVDPNNRAAAYRQAGHALARFHRDTEISTPKSGYDRIVRKTLSLVNELRAAGVALESFPPIEEFEAALRRVKNSRPAKSWIHGDFKPEHVFVSASGCCFVDADRLRPGYGILDVGGMINHVEWLLGPDSAAAVAFAAGYREVQPLEPDALLLARIHGALRTTRNRSTLPTCKDTAAPLATLNDLWSDLASRSSDL